MYISRMSAVSVSLARRTLAAQLDRVEAGEEVEITRYGRVVTVLVHPNVLKVRRTSSVWSAADRIGDMLERAKNEPLKPPSLSEQYADELIESARADRLFR